MIRRSLLSALMLLAAAGPAVAKAPALPPVRPGFVRVELVTSDGPITLDLDRKHAPITTNNFLRYVDEKRLDGTFFYRAARTRGAPKQGFIQGGTSSDYRRVLNGIAHEPTTKTGIHHVAGTISMARTTPGSASGNFFITASAIPAMDAHPGAKGDNLGYAAFGHVVSGMGTVRKILAEMTGRGGSEAMRGEMIAKPVRIISARRK